MLAVCGESTVRSQALLFEGIGDTVEATDSSATAQGGGGVGGFFSGLFGTRGGTGGRGSTSEPPATHKAIPPDAPQSLIATSRPTEATPQVRGQPWIIPEAASTKPALLPPPPGFG